MQLIPLNAASNGQELSWQCSIFALGQSEHCQPPCALMELIMQVAPLGVSRGAAQSIPLMCMVAGNAHFAPGQKLSIASSILVHLRLHLVGSTAFFILHRVVIYI